MLLALLAACSAKNTDHPDLGVDLAVPELPLPDLSTADDGGTVDAGLACALPSATELAARASMLGKNIAAVSKKPTTTVRDMVFAADWLLLYGNDVADAVDMLSTAMMYQCMGSPCPTGLFLFHTTDAVTDMGPTDGYDYNSTTFTMQALIPILGAVSTDELTALKPHIDLALAALDATLPGITPGDQYTNIWLMRATDLVLISEFLNDRFPSATYAKYASDGYGFLATWKTHVMASGIDEYDSPTYYGTDFDSLTLGARMAKQPTPFVDAATYLWTDVAASFFYANGMLSGPHSRDYDFVDGAGAIETYAWLAGWRRTAPEDTETFEPIAGGIFAYANAVATNAYQPPATLLPLACATDKRVTQSWETAVGRDRSNWIGAHVTLGVTSADYVDATQEKIFDAELDGAAAAISLVMEDDEPTSDNPYGAKTPQGKFSKPFRLGSLPVAVQHDGLALVTSYAVPLASHATSLLTSNVLLPTGTTVGVTRNGAALAQTPGTSVTLAVGDVIGVATATGAAALRVFRAADCTGAPVLPELRFETAEVDGVTTSVARVVAYHAQAFLHDMGVTVDDTCGAPFGMLVAVVDCDGTTPCSAEAGSSGSVATDRPTLQADAAWANRATVLAASSRSAPGIGSAPFGSGKSDRSPSRQALRRARRRRIQLLRNPPRARGQPPRLDRQPHRMGHAKGIFRAGDPGIEQDAVAAEFHRDDDVAGRADAGVDDDGIARIISLQVFEDDPDVIGIQNALAAADRAAGGHHAGGAGGLEVAGHDGIVAGVAEDGEALGDEDSGRVEGGDGVGQERAGVGEDFQFHPVGAAVPQAGEDFPTHPGGAEGVVGVEAAGGVGEDGVAVGIDEVEQLATGFVLQPLPADGHGDNLSAAGGEAVAHQLQTGVFPGADEQPAPQFEGADPDRRVLGRPAADERDDFEDVAMSQYRLGVPRTRDEDAINLDRDVFRPEFEPGQQLGDRERAGEVPRLAIEGDRHGAIHSRTAIGPRPGPIAPPLIPEAASTFVHRRSPPRSGQAGDRRGRRSRNHFGAATF